MANQTATGTTEHQIALEAYGVGMVVSADSPELLRRVEQVLPPGWRRRDAPDDDDKRFVLAMPDGTSYRIQLGEGGAIGGSSSDVQVALDMLDVQLRAHVALQAPDRIFVHAGVVGYRGRAIVIPGASFTGKTTLVAELVRAGAAYYSDEFAVLDADGLVHPYTKPLSVRDGGLNAQDHPVESIGGIAGEQALPVGLIIVAEYRPDASWQPRRLSPGESALALLANTIPAQERPEQALGAIRRAVADATAFEGQRGEAADIVDELLEQVTAGAGAESPPLSD